MFDDREELSISSRSRARRSAADRESVRVDAKLSQHEPSAARSASVASAMWRWEAGTRAHIGTRSRP